MTRIRSQREITLTDNLFAGRESFDFDEIFFVRPSLELSIQAALKTLCVEDDFSITKNKSGSGLIFPAWSHNYRKQIIIYWLLFSGVCLYVKELDAKIRYPFGTSVQIFCTHRPVYLASFLYFNDAKINTLSELTVQV